MSKCSLWGISSAGRAPALQAGGRRFDPVILHHHLVLAGMSAVLVAVALSVRRGVQKCCPDLTRKGAKFDL